MNRNILYGLAGGLAAFALAGTTYLGAGLADDDKIADGNVSYSASEDNRNNNYNYGMRSKQFQKHQPNRQDQSGDRSRQDNWRADKEDRKQSHMDNSKNRHQGGKFDTRNNDNYSQVEEAIKQKYPQVEVKKVMQFDDGSYMAMGNEDHQRSLILVSKDLKNIDMKTRSSDR